VSATIVVRRLAASPKRTAAETWTTLVNLVAPRDATGRSELGSAVGVGPFLIAAEALKESPAVMWGVGPRLRMYTLHGDAAVDGEDMREDPLTWSPTQGEWHLSLPCPDEDLKWVSKALAAVSSRITARSLAESAPSDEPSPKAAPLSIDIGEFSRS
jgi:hypothetical protein